MSSSSSSSKRRWTPHLMDSWLVLLLVCCSTMPSLVPSATTASTSSTRWQQHAPPAPHQDDVDVDTDNLSLDYWTMEGFVTVLAATPRRRDEMNSEPLERALALVTPSQDLLRPSRRTFHHLDPAQQETNPFRDEKVVTGDPAAATSPPTTSTVVYNSSTVWHLLPAEACQEATSAAGFPPFHALLEFNGTYALTPNSQLLEDEFRFWESLHPSPQSDDVDDDNHPRVFLRHGMQVRVFGLPVDSESSLHCRAILDDRAQLFWGAHHRIFLVKYVSVLDMPQSDISPDEARHGGFPYPPLASRGDVVALPPRQQRRQTGSGLTAVDLRRMVVFITYFDTSEVGCNATAIDDILWRNHYSVRSSFETNSFGYVEIGGDIAGNQQWDIFGPYKIDFQVDPKKQTKEDCDANKWADKVDDIARSAGVDLDRYQHRLYVIPREADEICKWEGLGLVGCSLSCRAWVNTCDRMETFVHELGHNMNFRHSGSDWDERGDKIEYGDPTAFMGNSFFSSDAQLTFTAVHKAQVGWLKCPSGQSTVVAATTGDHEFTLSPVNDLPSNSRPDACALQTVAIPRGIAFGYYFLSFMTIRSNYSHQMLVHRLDSTYRGQINNPTSNSYIVAALKKPGMSFQDPDSRFSVTLWSITTQQMKVRVAFSCVSRATVVDFYQFHPVGFRDRLHVLEPYVPQRSVSTETRTLVLHVGSDGASVKRTVVVRIANQDSPLCTPMTYEVSFSVRSVKDNATLTQHPLVVELPSRQVIPPTDGCYVSVGVSAQSVTQDDEFEVLVDISGSTLDGVVLADHSKTLSLFVSLLVKESASQSTSEASCLSVQFSDRRFRDSGAVFTVATSSRLVIGAIVSRCAGRLTELVDVSISGSVDAAWTISVQPETVSIAPGSSTFVTLFLDIPATPQNATLSLTATSPSLQSTRTVLRLLSEVRAPCASPVTLRVEPSTFLLETRSTVAVSVLETNNDADDCGPRLFLSIPINDRSALVPQMQLIRPNDAVERRAMYTSVLQTSSKASNISIPFMLFDAFAPEAQHSVGMLAVVERTECVWKAPIFEFFCPTLVNNVTTGVLSMVCRINLRNWDTWPCPTTLFGINWFFSPSASYTSIFPDSMRLYPYNYSWGMTYTVNLPVVPPPEVLNGSQPEYSLNTTVVLRDLTTTDPVASALHSRTLTILTRIGACVCEAPSVSWPSNVPVVYEMKNVSVGNTTELRNVSVALVEEHIGGVGSTTILVGQRCNIFCGSSTMTFGMVVHTKDANVARYGFEPFANLGSDRSWGSYQVRAIPFIVSNSPLVLAANGSYFNGTNLADFPITIQISDSHNASAITQIDAIIRVGNSCVWVKPVVKLVGDPPAAITTGRSRSFVVPIQVSNKDQVSAGCDQYYPGRSPVFYFNARGTGGSLSTPATVTLPANTSQILNVTVTTVDNIPPGVYPFFVGIYDSRDPSNLWHHSEQMQFPVAVECPVPRSVSQVTAKAVVPFFSYGLQAGPVFLSWEACSHPLWCCCPCSFIVERNGEVIGNSTSLNFTDVAHLKTGEQYVYTITTVDVRGVRSSEFVCNNFITLELRPLSLDNFVVWIISTLSTLVALAIVIPYLSFVILAWPQLKRGEPVKYGGPIAYLVLSTLARWLNAVWTPTKRACSSCFASIGRGLKKLLNWVRNLRAVRWVREGAVSAWRWVRDKVLRLVNSIRRCF